jgi:hypothetical protein
MRVRNKWAEEIGAEADVAVLDKFVESSKADRVPRRDQSELRVNGLRVAAWTNLGETYGIREMPARPSQDQTDTRRGAEEMMDGRHRTAGTWNRMGRTTSRRAKGSI